MLPEQFGRFLCAIFDEWVRHDVGSVFVQTFEATCATGWACHLRGCAFSMKPAGPGWRSSTTATSIPATTSWSPIIYLGNIEKEHMLELVASPQQFKFGQDKRDTLPRYCQECDVRFACHGECPKNRFILTPDGEPGLNYLCAGFKEFFHHASFPMKIMAGLIRRGREAKEVMAILEQTFAGVHRLDPCPCGSGRKFRQCHGRHQPVQKSRRCRSVISIHNPAGER